MERVSVNEDDVLMLCPTVPWDDHKSGGQVCAVPHLLPRGTEAEGNCQHTKAGTHNIMGSATQMTTIGVRVGPQSSWPHILLTVPMCSDGTTVIQHYVTAKLGPFRIHCTLP